MHRTMQITDWWEEFIYLRPRAPIMINSNYYGLDKIGNLGCQQSARAANCVHAALLFRRMIERSEISPVRHKLNKHELLQFSVSGRSKVPFCTMQYERMFNTTRIPGEELDVIKTYPDARHIAVLHKGCWYRVRIHTGKRLAYPIELQQYARQTSRTRCPTFSAFQHIIDRTADAMTGENLLGALTAADRKHWARTRKDFFSRGVNKTSLHCIEKAAFVVVLDDVECDYDAKLMENVLKLAPRNSEDAADYAKLDAMATRALHGTGTDRWYDKSFNMVVTKNGKLLWNVEHSWGDAAVSAHLIEYVLYTDMCQLGYTADGDCKPIVGDETPHELEPQRLQWDLQGEVSLAPHKCAILAVLRMHRTFLGQGRGADRRRGNEADAVARVRQGVHQEVSRVARRLHPNGAAVGLSARE